MRVVLFFLSVAGCVKNFYGVVKPFFFITTGGVRRINLLFLSICMNVGNVVEGGLGVT